MQRREDYQSFEHGYHRFDQLEVLILDEADKMLDMGFYDDIMKIITYLPAKRQNLLFSATMPPKMRELAKKILHHPEEINIAMSKPAEGIMQGAYLLNDAQKTPLLKTLLVGKKFTSVLIFASTKSGVKALERELRQLHLRRPLQRSRRKNGKCFARLQEQKHADPCGNGYSFAGH